MNDEYEDRIARMLGDFQRFLTRYTDRVQKLEEHLGLEFDYETRQYKSKDNKNDNTNSNQYG